MLGIPPDAGSELLGVLAEGVVEQPDVDRAACSQGLERRGRELDCHLRADTSRQQVGPLLGAVEAAHVRVIGVEDEGSASPPRTLREQVAGHDGNRQPVRD